MRFIKSVFFILCLFFPASGGLLSAQVSIEPGNEFYTDLVSWSVKGYVSEPLPQIKPYPLNVIKKILSEVRGSGDSDEAARAAEYERLYIEKPWRAASSVKGDVKLKQVERGGNGRQPVYEDHEIFLGGLNFSSDVSISEKIGFAANVNFLAANNSVALYDVLPQFMQNSSQNKVRAFYVESGGVDFIADLNGGFSYGTESLYLTLGFSKNAFGLYPGDSIVLNPSAYQALNASFNYIGSHVSFSQIFMLLGAKSFSDPNLYSLGKYLAFHSVKVPLFEGRLNVSCYESVVFGKDFTPFYLMPAPYLVIGNVSGFNDNVFAGLGLELRPLPCVAITGDVYVDDTILKKLLKLDLNESATRVSFKTGILYAPYDSVCSLISVDYSLATPYTYTFLSPGDSDYNFHDYSNYGINLGSNLPPNSDRVSLGVSFKPLPGWKLATKTSLVRHGNACESLSDEEALSLSRGDSRMSSYSDGGLGMTANGLSTATSYTNFLRQPSIMYLVQAGFSTCVDFLLGGGVCLSFDADYTFEYIKGDGVGRAIYPGTYSTVEEVRNARALWKLALHDSYNHYFTLGVRVSY